MYTGAGPRVGLDTRQDERSAGLYGGGEPPTIEHLSTPSKIQTPENLSGKGRGTRDTMLYLSHSSHPCPLIQECTCIWTGPHIPHITDMCHIPRIMGMHHASLGMCRYVSDRQTCLILGPDGKSEAFHPTRIPGTMCCTHEHRNLHSVHPLFNLPPYITSNEVCTDCDPSRYPYPHPYPHPNSNLDSANPVPNRRRSCIMLMLEWRGCTTTWLCS